ncbi:MAG: preprotein translocase subunit SecE [Elusimicrobiota bacterium]|nr:preprotein translocase subunit SecE [Elusimicrobiota bacterium]
MNKAINFVRESYMELKKSVWLSRAQMMQSTLFVFIVVAIISLYISGVDFILSWILGKVIGN